MLETHYVTETGLLVTIHEAGHHPDGQQSVVVATVQTVGGGSGWGRGDIAVPRTWSSERIARHVLECAQAAVGCTCADPDCPGKSHTFEDVFPGDAHAMRLDLYLDVRMAQAACMVEAGLIDDERMEQGMPTMQDMLDELDGKPTRAERQRREPPDPHDGSTWKLG